MTQKIYFATNRKQTGTSGGKPVFGDEPVATNQPFVCAVASVDGIDPMDQNSGAVSAVSALSPGGFAAADLNALLKSKNDVLVFIHGTMNDFDAAMTRAAYNQAWLAQTPVKGTAHSYDTIVFTWPGRDYAITSLFDFTDAIEGYEHDRNSAAHSNTHIAAFFRMLVAMKPKLGTRRVHLLCHSMGCYALGGAVETLYRAAGAPTAALFDEAVLAAGDEDSATFTKPKGGRLSRLSSLAREITVYFNRNDIAMHLSGVVNHAFHLGYYGPPNMRDVKVFPPKIYEFVNCIGLKDYIDTPQHPEEIDHTHQYYRESPTVRADIAAQFAGEVPVRPYYYKDENFYAFVKVDFSGIG